MDYDFKEYVDEKFLDQYSNESGNKKHLPMTSSKALKSSNAMIASSGGPGSALDSINLPVRMGAKLDNKD